INLSTSHHTASIVTQYYDGLGRPLQTVMKAASPGISPKDLVQPMLYDTYGRPSHELMMYAASTSTGTFKSNPNSEYQSSLSGIYTNDGHFFGRKTYEASLSGRVTKQTAPGHSWAGSNV